MRQVDVSPELMELRLELAKEREMRKIVEHDKQVVRACVRATGSSSMTG